MCPILTTSQIVPRGFKGEVALLVEPHSEVPVPSAQSLIPTGKIDLSALGKTATVYQIKGEMGGGLALDTPKGTRPDDPNPTLLAQPLMVKCQGPACAFWGEAIQDCRLPAQPRNPNQTQGGESAPESDES
jgi:hypothetical protein